MNPTCSTGKPAFALTENIQAFIEHYGIERCGFLTLTFADGIECVFEASRRFNSLRTGFLGKIMNAYIGVYERHKSGAVHFHFVLACKQNIASEYRKGRLVQFDAVSVRKGNYRSAPKALRDLWAQLRETLPKYGFARHQLLPVASGRGIAKYLAKYLAKGMAQRQERDKGFRLVRSTSGKAAVKWRRVSGSFAWSSSVQWREALADYLKEKALLARYRLNKHGARYFKKLRQELEALAVMDEGNYSEIMKRLYGPKWCYAVKEYIVEEWAKNRNTPDRVIYFYEMAEDAYETLKYSPANGLTV